MKRVLTVVALAAICAGGCTSYYKVTDPTTGKAYYTTEVRQKGNGAATLKDGRTGNMVTIQNSEVDQITKEEYESGKAQMPTAAPADKQDQAPAASANPFK